MTHKEKAEQYVRDKLHLYREEQIACPDGIVGCCVLHVKREPLPLALHHWLRVLGEVETSKTVMLAGNEFCVFVSPNIVNFNLTTGQPATEADYKAFNEIVGI